MGSWLLRLHGENRDYLDIKNIWSRELIEHHRGQFSMASIQSNDVMEEHCQVEVGSDALFVGLYDGHGGNGVSKYLAQHFFPNLLSRYREKNQEMSLLNILKEVASDMERDILEHKELDKVGSSCLVALIWREKLYILNIGDSRLLLGSELGNTKIIKAIQLSNDHNCKNDKAIQLSNDRNCKNKQIMIEGQNQHPDSNILNQDDNKISRAIGDACLKRNFNLSAEPDIISRDIGKYDRCIIIASHGFWELMSNEQTTLVVERNPRHGIAKKLLREALKEAAKTKGIQYEQLMNEAKGPGGKHRYHEDITIIVVFLNKKNWWRRDIQKMSYRGFTDTVESTFAFD